VRVLVKTSIDLVAPANGTVKRILVSSPRHNAQAANEVRDRTSALAKIRPKWLSTALSLRPNRAQSQHPRREVQTDDTNVGAGRAPSGPAGVCQDMNSRRELGQSPGDLRARAGSASDRA
jgi:hypothetical protein